MTHEQSNRESQEAARIKQEMLGKAYDGVQGIMADIYRRVFDEPWFGRQSLDLMYERHSGFGEHHTPLLYDPDKARQNKAAGQGMTMDEIREKFYGQQPEREQTRTQGQGMEY